VLGATLGPLATSASAQNPFKKLVQKAIKKIAQPEPADRFDFKIDPRTPLADLLPPAPDVATALLPWQVDDLTRVPEVRFARGTTLSSKDAGEREIAHTIAKVNHLNKQGTDHFIEMLRAQRPDLAGLPFAMGDACRQGKDRGWAFGQELALVRIATRRQEALAKDTQIVVQEPLDAKTFWTKYTSVRENVVREVPGGVQADPKEAAHSRVAALMQVLAPEPQAVQLGLVTHLASIEHLEATRALARLAVFSSDPEVRKPALTALERRPSAEYRAVLEAALRYPWPAVVHNAGAAIAELKCKELVPQLVALLEEPDPRAPREVEIQGKKTRAVRELVRLNHHKNCLLCHAPGNAPDLPAEIVTAPVPPPERPLTPQSQGYDPQTAPDILVRIDVTYLRQDFSLLQSVPNAAPWPERQRFDFLVRMRAVSPDEVEAYRQWRRQQPADYLAPHQQASIAALRALTGLEVAEPTAAAWRAALAKLN
jgi:hypothetical protein